MPRSVLTAKRRLLKYPDGFKAQFYTISEIVTPVLAWGFFGTFNITLPSCYLLFHSTFLGWFFQVQTRISIPWCTSSRTRCWVMCETFIVFRSWGRYTRSRREAVSNRLTKFEICFQILRLRFCRWGRRAIIKTTARKCPETVESGRGRGLCTNFEGSIWEANEMVFPTFFSRVTTCCEEARGAGCCIVLVRDENVSSLNASFGIWSVLNIHWSQTWA